MKAMDINKPHLIITMGIPGSGKSFFANHFAETFKAPIISHDILHKNILLNSQNQLNTDQTEIILNHMLSEVLKTGRTTVYEGNTSTRAERKELLKNAKDAGYEPLFVWVQTEPMTAKRRVVKKSAEKQLTPDEFDLRLKRFSAPHISEKFVVISGKHTYASQLKIVLKHLVRPSVSNDKQPTRPLIKRNHLIR